ncbi:MAG: Hpt domain-containing protein [Pseudomonadota bacterium]
MTTSIISNAPPLVVGADFDREPLSWVIAEIRESLNRSSAALAVALNQPAQEEERNASLRQAKNHLHQAHGALQIVDVEGVALLTETVEDMLDRMASGQLALAPQVVSAIDHGYSALVEYLQELLAGEVPQPVRLFPYYRDLLQARGAERIHPADLFFPNLAIRPTLPARLLDAPGAAFDKPAAPDYVALRKRFEKALLPFLKGTVATAGTANGEQLHDIVGEVEHAQTNHQLRGFWWVMRGFAEAVAIGKIDNDVYVKQLFARINLQIRRLSDGSSGIAERLLRDALFFIVRIDQPTPLLQQIRAAYGLNGQVSGNFEEKRYGRVDGKALNASREHLARAKTHWNRLVGGEGHAAVAFEQEMLELSQVAQALRQPALSKLLGELTGIAHSAANREPGDRVGLEMATSLLFVENALAQISKLPIDFSSRAEAMMKRLAASVSGHENDTLALPTPWLDDMSRLAQQRQTVVTLATELQSSLQQVEKMLEEYFAHPGEVASLTPVDKILHQVGGALAVLDQDEAARAVAHTQKALQRFADAATPFEHGESQQQFQHIARNIGALGFFVETLHLHDDKLEKRFFFDDSTGVFQARLFERVANLPVADDLPAIEAISEVIPDAIPEEPELLETTELPTVLDSAAIIANPIAPTEPVGAESMLPEFSPFELPGPDVFAKDEPATELELPQTDEEVDAELLEIFLIEANEVLEAVRITLPAARLAPHDQEHLTTLRRSFHTLKGSGRMVGLTAFGEAAWSIEQLINLRLAQSRAGDADLYALLELAASTLAEWVNDLQTTGRSGRTPDLLIESAARLEAGLSLAALMPVETEPVVEGVPANDEETRELIQALQTLPELELEPEPEFKSDPELESELLQSAASDKPPSERTDLMDLAATESVIPVAEKTSVIEFPAPAATPAPRNDSLRQIGEIEISVALHNIYMAETDGLVRLLSLDFGEWRHEPERLVNLMATHAAHSLAGTSATVGFKPLQEIAQALEAVLQQLSRTPVRLLDTEFDMLDLTMERIRFMLQLFALGEMADHEPLQVGALEALHEILCKRAVTVSAESGEFTESTPLDTMIEAIPDEITHQAPDQKLDQVATDDMPTLAALLSRESVESTESPVPALAKPQAPLELQAPVITPSLDVSFGKPDSAPEVPMAGRTLVIKDDLDADLMPVFIEEANDMLPQMGRLLRTWQLAPGDTASPPALLRLLHTIKGSARMAGAMRFGQHLHDMESRIEQVMHLSQQPPQVLDDLLARHDLGLQMFDALHHQDAIPTDAATAGNSTVDDSLTATNSPAVPAIGLSAVVVTEQPPSTEADHFERRRQRRMPADIVTINATPVPLVRVRADILDRLVNQAGEVSIARSRLENEIGTMRQSLVELTENVARLREQLREVEMQAESQIENQISSQRANSPEKQFDPLEFDRFTRLQELTRMMAESVNDVGSVQQNLTRTLDSASIDLTMQARLTRDLQQDLMSVRMVQFASVTERLYRVTRQASKEIDKRVNLDIRGSAVELDRSVLEKMAGPFEHLLRNAIVHGIETRAGRQAAGKSEVGELQIEVRQEGNEVVIEFCDDGQGLSLERIRSKAEQTGLLGLDRTISDAELTDLIFHPGFSTATAVTELAGRGIGMDVVRAEATALGGRVAIVSEPGKGARFTVHLPLTLAVTQVVLLTTGGKTYAVPSVLVEQVQQLRTPALVAAYNEGAVTWQSQRVPMVYLASLLGENHASAVSQQYSPLILLKSGNNRLAVHVDEIIGNREVVVKNIGPQLARLAGIAGATVLGSGEIVLILNPVALAQRAAQEQGRAISHGGGYADIALPETMGAVAEFDHGGSEGGNQGESSVGSNGGKIVTQAVPGLQIRHIVMVVDDSLTVRRVTQRLLSREGYQVVLAKDGIDALEQLQSITPDVMLVDIEMPRMDGFDLTRNLRGDERTRHIPIIMITSRSASKHRNHAFELGVDEYLGKPYQEDVLLATIAGFVRKGTPVA